MQKKKKFYTIVIFVQHNCDFEINLNNWFFHNCDKCQKIGKKLMQKNDPKNCLRQTISNELTCYNQSWAPIK